MFTETGSYGASACQHVPVEPATLAVAIQPARFAPWDFGGLAGLHHADLITSSSRRRTQVFDILQEFPAPRIVSGGFSVWAGLLLTSCDNGSHNNSSRSTKLTMIPASIMF